MRVLLVLVIVASLGCRHGRGSGGVSVPRSLADVGAVLAAIGGVMIYAGAAGETDDPVVWIGTGIPIASLGLYLAFRDLFTVAPTPPPPP